MLTVLSGVRWYSIHRTAPWLLPGLGKGYSMLGQREAAPQEMSRHLQKPLVIPLPTCLSQEVPNTPPD